MSYDNQLGLALQKGKTCKQHNFVAKGKTLLSLRDGKNQIDVHTCSMRYVTWLRPYFTTIGFFASTVFPSFSAWALFKSLSFLAALSSGRYFRSILNKFVAEMENQTKN
jgi:hypothetical protein